MFKRAAFTGLVCLLVQTAVPARADDGEWESLGTKSGIALYSKRIPGSPVIAFKGEGVIDAPLIAVASVILDHGRAPEWMDSLVESRVVRVVGPFEYVEYNHLRAPPMVSDRDFVADVKMRVDADAKTFTMTYHSIDDPSAPASKCVRGSVDSVFVMTSIEHGTKTRLAAEMHADPMGALPKFLVNFFQRAWPVKAFEGVRRQSAKTDLGRPAAFAEVLRQVERISR